MDLMQKAAKEKSWWLWFIALAMLTSAPSFASSIDVLHGENRVEIFLLEGQNRTGQQTFHSAKHVENYDPSWGVALESSVAPNTGLPIVNGKFVPDYWRMKPTARGTLIEDALAKSDYADWFRVGQLDNGYFQLVDFQKGLDFVSLKTVNTNGRSWLYSMRRHIDELAEAEAGVGDQVGRIILDIRVQPGGTSAAQSLIEYGRKLGIPVIIKEFP